MTRDHPRMRRERNTVEAMIGLYCHGQHGTGNGLCPDCASLQEVARQRLEKCPFQEGKTTCARCPVHCYKPDMRARIRAVMRYAGPRMLAHHPIMALQHVADGLRAEPIGPHGAKATKRDRT
jgi:predicted amidophosphoribosyltransferase